MCNSMANSLDTNPIQSTWELAWIELLSYHAHLKKSAAKVSTRNLLRLLVGSSWGASATTLRTSALAHCYSTAEYCAPVWATSPYTKLIDVQLNESMHIVSGALHPTPFSWLPSWTLPLHLLDSTYVDAEPLLHWSWSMCSQPCPLESGFRFVLFLWRTFTNYVTHCE